MRTQKPKKNGVNSNSVKRKPKKQKKNFDVKIKETGRKIYSINTPYAPSVDIEFKEDTLIKKNNNALYDMPSYEYYGKKSDGIFYLVVITVALSLLLIGYLLI